MIRPAENPALDPPLERPLPGPRPATQEVLDLLASGGGQQPPRPGMARRAGTTSRTWFRAHRVSLPVMTTLLGIVGVVHGVGMTRMPGPVDDEGTYMAQAWAVQVRHTLTPYTYWYDHPPLGWIQISGWTFFTHGLSSETIAIASGRHMMLVYVLVDAALLYMIARRLELSRVWSSVAVLAFGLSPVAVDYQRMVYLDNVAMPWLLGAFVLALTPQRRLWTYGASGACLAVAVLSKETMLILAPAVVYLAWQRSDRATRAFCVTAQAAVFALFVSVYPLLALLKGELVPGPGHVSLASAVSFQLAGRQGTGDPFSRTSQAHGLVMGWLHLDPWLLTAGALCVPFGLVVRRFRPIAIAQLTALCMVVKGGYLPVPYVIELLPFGALLIAAAGSTLTARVTPSVRRLRAAGRVAILVAVCAALLGAAAPAWASGLRAQMTDDQMTPTVKAEHWLERHVPRTQRLLTDDTMWVDLVDHGWNRPLGVVWFYKLGYVNNLDPSVARKLPGGWRDFKYVVVTPSIRAALEGSPGGLPQIEAAVMHSVPVAVFGVSPDQIVVRRVVPTPTRPTSETKNRRTPSRSEHS